MSPVQDESTPLLAPSLQEVELGACPKSKQSRWTTTPLPMKRIIILNVLIAMQPIVFELIFPFINQMILETGVTDDPESVGYYSGSIESIFAFMSFLAIIPMSNLSDRYGRKPIILIGILGLAVSTTFFGMSQSYMAMIISRCIGGLSGATWSSIKIMTAEITDRTNQGQAFGYLMISYRTGQMLGLPMGGFLAHPERRFSMFQHNFWYKYPFALPCFFASSLAMIAVVIAYFTLEETLPGKNKPVTIDERCGTRENSTVRVIKKAAIKDVLTPHARSILLSTTAMCFVCETLFALYPIFAFTPIESGGLGVSEAVIGTHMSIRSLIPLPMMLFYPTLQRRLGTVHVYQIVMTMFPIVVVFFPLLNMLAKASVPDWLFNIALSGYFLIWSFCGFAWPTSSIMVNDVATSPEALATINGISQMGIVLPQAIAPAVATALFATSIRNPFLDGYSIWLLLFILACGAVIHSFTLREPTQDWREELKRDDPVL